MNFETGRTTEDSPRLADPPRIRDSRGILDSPRIPDSRSIPDSLRWGVGLAFATALISGFSIFVNGFAVKQVPDAAVYTTLKNAIAALLLVGIATATVRRSDVAAMDGRSWLRLTAIAIVGGSVPFLLFFTGLAQASAPSAAFIQKTLFIWVAILAVPFLGERLGFAQLGALAVLLGGQFLVIRPSGVTWGSGETMIAAATLLWAVESIMAKRLLASVPSQIVGAGRLGIGLVVLIGFLVVTGRVESIAALTFTQWAWVLGTGVILSAYVATWFAALRRAPASLVTAILVVGAPITAVLQAIQAGAFPGPIILAGEVLITMAAILLAIQAMRRPAHRDQPAMG
ncbi:MAG: DMT family transporter [Chloroflexi bacterium]|nr:DMT family transporter [Chloroflexota bacterium]